MKVSTWLQICNNMKLWVVCLTRKSYVWKVVILSFVLFICVLQWVSNCKGHNFSTRNLPPPPPPPMVMIMASIFKCNAHISKSNQPVLHKSLSIVHYIQMHTTIWKIKYLLPFYYDFNEHNQCESDKTMLISISVQQPFILTRYFLVTNQYQLENVLSVHTFWMSCIKYLFKYWLLVQSAPLSGTKGSTLCKSGWIRRPTNQKRSLIVNYFACSGGV